MKEQSWVDLTVESKAVVTAVYWVVWKADCWADKTASHWVAS